MDPTSQQTDVFVAKPLGAAQPGVLAGNAIKPYLSEDGLTFAQDFWVSGFMGALKGASVKEYEYWLGLLGRGGFFGKPEDGRKPPHLFVLESDSPDNLGVMTSPGTPVEHGGPGWIPAGRNYQFDPTLKNLNFIVWCRAGAPKKNDYGDWSQAGRSPEEMMNSWAASYARMQGQTAASPDPRRQKNAGHGQNRVVQAKPKK